METAVSEKAPILCPYKGLDPYDETYRDYFFGRERDQIIITANLRTVPLTVFYGASGVGKSSVLQAAVIPPLRDNEDSVVVIFREWQGDFHRALLEKILAACSEAARLGIDLELPLDEFLLRITEASGRTVLLILDQFEEYFLYHPAKSEFDAELARAINRKEIDAHFLLSMREDGLSLLDRFKGRVPNLLGNTLRLKHLDRQAAIDAICKPLKKYNDSMPPEARMEIETGLAEAIVDQVKAGQIVVGETGRGQVAEKSGETEVSVETPFLQMVLMRLWDDETRARSQLLRLSTFQRLGGAQGIVDAHVNKIVNKLTPGQRKIASEVFRFLVTQSGTKIAYPTEDLASPDYTGIAKKKLDEVLRLLSSPTMRLLRRVELHGQPERYELFHDVLAKPLLAWRAKAVEARRWRKIGRNAVLIMAAIAILFYASYQGLDRIQSESQAAQKARAIAASRALVDKAKAKAADKLDLALLLSLQAVEMDDSPESRGSLLSCLLGDSQIINFLRGHTKMVSALAFSADGQTLASSSWDGTIMVWNPYSGLVRPPLKAHGVWIGDMAFSPDRRRLVSGGSGLVSGATDGAVIIWDLAKAKPLHKFECSRTVAGVAFSPDGQMVAAAAEDAVIVWDTVKGTEIKKLGDHTDSINTVAFSSDGTLLASAGYDKTVIVRDAKTFAVKQRLESTAPIFRVAFRPETTELAASSVGGEIILWDAPTGRRLGSAPPSTRRKEAWGLAFDPTGIRLLSGSGDSTIKLWNVNDLIRENAQKSGTSTQASVWPEQVIGGFRYPVRSVAFSPDGQVIAAGYEDGTIMIRNIESKLPRLAQEIRSESGPAASLAYPDNGTVAVASGRWIVAWDVAASKWRGQPIQGHSDQVYGIAAIPNDKITNGKIIASASIDSTVRFWDLATGKPIGQPMDGHHGPLYAIAASRDGTLVATGGKDTTVRLWDVATQRQAGELTGHTKAISAVAFSPDGTRLASTAEDFTVRLWDLKKKEQVWEMTCSAPPFCATFSPDGNRLALGSKDGTIVLWDGHSGKQIVQPAGHGNAVTCLAFSPDGRNLASGSWDKTVALWDATTGSSLRAALAGHNSAVMSVAFSPDGRSLASSDNEGTLILWDPTTGTQRAGPAATCVGNAWTTAVSPDGSMLAAAGSAGSVSIWDLETFVQKPMLLRSHAKGVNGVAFSPDGNTVASAGSDKTIILSDLRTGDARVLQGNDEVYCLAFSPDGLIVASGGKDTRITRWSTDTGKQIGDDVTAHKSEVVSVIFSTDGKTLVSCDRNGSVYLHELRMTPPSTRELTNAGVFRLALSPDGKMLACGTTEGSVLLFDTLHWKQIGDLVDGHQALIISLAFSADGTMLASGSEDNNVVLWDVATRQQIHQPLKIHTAPVVGVAFTKANTLITAGEVPSMYRWDVSLDSWKRIACGIVGRKITEQEWERFLPSEAYAPAEEPAMLTSLGNSLALQGEREQAKALFARAVELAQGREDAILNNDVCWNGCLNGFAEIVLKAGERAVELAGKANRPECQDTRGLARALTGNTAGAIKDFLDYVEWAQVSGYEDPAEKRRHWIAELKAGKNPFSEEVLQELRTE